jgi:hypothetical protein
MGDRVVDCARLESVCAERHRGFESPPIRRASGESQRATKQTYLDDDGAAILALLRLHDAL